MGFQEDPKIFGDSSKARAVALKLLSYRARTEDEIRERLRAKGFSTEIIDSTIDDLKRSGLIDERGALEVFLRIGRDSKLLGARGIKDFLLKKGISKDAALEALSGFDEFDGAMRLLKRWLRTRSLNTPEEEKSFRGYLYRRGYSSDTIEKVLKRYKEEGDGI